MYSFSFILLLLEIIKQTSQTSSLGIGWDYFMNAVLNNETQKQRRGRRIQLMPAFSEVSLPGKLVLPGVN